ncbi:MAG TPA: ATP-binding protein [Verrucomicrobiales bacterium]|nr:PAS domain-containing protein [Verrucomicrobiae bacterium]MCP5552347.1 PAS domain-containing protein [Akkermansiaceae bacterium]HRX52928.1 ATP-binding protein [Verrucomicrobiales bacterium]
MKPGFIDKFIDRLRRADPDAVQRHVLRIVQEKGFLESVFDALREGVIVTGTGGRIHYINLAACALFGISRKDSLGEPIESRLRGLDWADLTRGGQVVSRDMEIFYPENRYLNFYVAPLHAEAEEKSEQVENLGHVLLLRDVTQSRRSEEERIESEKLNALTMLAAGVAHEIGNPLNSLNIHLQLIGRKLKKAPPKLAADLGEMVEICRGEVQRLDFIVTSFLSAVRPTSPQLRMVDINELLRDSVRFLAPEIADRGIKVVLRLHPTLPLLSVDEDQIKQVFYNILRNASQALGSGSKGRVTITTDMDDATVSMRFTDTGPGISPENLGRITEPYFTTKAAGSGLGLLIVHRIVREHGGEVEIKSREGDGTTVTIFLPRMEKRMRYLPGPSPEPTGSDNGDRIIDID